MPVEDGRWDDQEVDPASAASASLGSTSGPGAAPDEGLVYDEDTFEHGDASPSDQGPHPETQAQGESDPADASIATDPSEQEPLPEFDPKVRQDFEGLLYLGYLEDEFDWVGHRFKIRSLTVGEILEVGMLHKPYVGSLADVKAYQAAIVAACTVQVDHQPMPVPITNDRADTALSNRFNYVLRSWFPPTLDAIYERYLLLEARVRGVLEAMGKAHGSTQSTRTLNGTSA
jgi:hypothetical protein